MKGTKGIVFLFLALVVGCFAQPGNREPSIRVLLLTPGGATMDLFMIAGDPKKVTGPFLVGARGLSDAVSPGAGSFVFAVEHGENESGFREVAEVALPDSGKDFIVLLETDGQRLVPHVVMGNEGRFGNSATMFFNATDVPIGASLGENKLLIQPRKPVIGEAPKKGERPWYQVTFYEPREGGEPKMFANTRWPFQTASRSYVFFYRSEKNQRIRYQAVDEILLAPEDKE